MTASDLTRVLARTCVVKCGYIVWSLL